MMQRNLGVNEIIILNILLQWSEKQTQTQLAESGISFPGFLWLQNDKAPSYL